MRKMVGRLLMSLDGVVEAPDKWEFDAFDDDVREDLRSQISGEDTMLLDPDPKPETGGGFDLPGAFLVTASIVAAVYAIVGAATNPPAVSALLILLSAALMVAFAAVERRTKVPLVPPGVFARSRNLTVSNVVMALAVVGMVGWFFFSALYLQRVLGYDSLGTGLAYLPATVALGAISQGPAAWAVIRFRSRSPGTGPWLL